MRLSTRQGLHPKDVPEPPAAPFLFLLKCGAIFAMQKGPFRSEFVIFFTKFITALRVVDDRGFHHVPRGSRMDLHVL